MITIVTLIIVFGTVTKEGMKEGMMTTMTMLLLAMTINLIIVVHQLQRCH
jgi:hypothetical protein